MPYDFLQWNPQTDVLVQDETPLLESTNPIVISRMPWAYALNTAKGLFRLSVGTKFSEPSCLLLDTDKETKQLFEDVTVWATDYYNSFMIVSFHKSHQTVLIDSRGVMFEIPFYRKRYGREGVITQNKRDGCYLIDGIFAIRYKTDKQQKEYEEKIKPDLTAIFNKEFNRFVRNNAHNETKYLYLTIGESKCGALTRFFISQGMQYEVVPNMLCDDDSLNIRIPLNQENYQRKDVQFLCAKYKNTYAIYHIPYKCIGGGLELSDEWKRKNCQLGFYMPNDKELLVYSIINTFRAMFSTKDDYEVYKKTLSKVVRMIDRGNADGLPNQFSDILLPYAYCDDIARVYLDKYRNYVNSLYGIHGNMQNHPGLYHAAYYRCLEHYKEVMKQYESGVLYQIAKSGGRISYWTNESTLFTMAAKLYPDAIYQYHCAWLNLQSLDIFIPSINVGIEYQGEQHYYPVDVFGGEEGFNSLVKRDRRKEILCKQHGVKLIKWKYDEVLSISRLKEKIQDILG